MLQRDWDAFYMGNDGEYTFYIDAVKQEFAINSTTKTRKTTTGFFDVARMFKQLKEKV